jgi:hypothetical protein
VSACVKLDIYELGVTVIKALDGFPDLAKRPAAMAQFSPDPFYHFKPSLFLELEDPNLALDSPLKFRTNNTNIILPITFKSVSPLTTEILRKYFGIISGNPFSNF